MSETVPDGTEVRLKAGMPGTYAGQTAIVRHQSPSGHSNLPRLVWLECEVIWSHGTADGFWAARVQYALPTPPSPAVDDLGAAQPTPNPKKENTMNDAETEKMVPFGLPPPSKDARPEDVANVVRYWSG